MSTRQKRAPERDVKLYRDIYAETCTAFGFEPLPPPDPTRDLNWDASWDALWDAVFNP